MPRSKFHKPKTLEAFMFQNAPKGKSFYTDRSTSHMTKSAIRHKRIVTVRKMIGWVNTNRNDEKPKADRIVKVTFLNKPMK